MLFYVGGVYGAWFGAVRINGLHVRRGDGSIALSLAEKSRSGSEVFPRFLLEHFCKISVISKLIETFQSASLSSQRKLGSSAFAVSKSLGPSFRWDDEQKTCRYLAPFPP